MGWAGGVLWLDCWNFWRVVGGWVECELDFHTQTGAGTGCSQHTERAAQAAVKLLKLYLLSHSLLS